MGEPLMNLSKVVSAYYWINEHMKINPRNFKITTVGVPKAIRYLAERKLTLRLSISLHSAYQELREQLVPSAKDFILTELFKDCRWYFNRTGCRVTFEYTLLKGVNDSAVQARHLARKLRQQDCQSHVDLMLWNRVSGMDYEESDLQTAENFQEWLTHHSIPSRILMSRGREKSASYGQLRNEFQKRPLKEIVPLG